MSVQTEKLFPRVRNKLQVRPMGLLSGLIAGFGLIVLLQQFAILVPTRSVLIAGPIIGVVSSVVLNTLGRSLGVRRLNSRLKKAEATVFQKEASSSQMATPAESEGWTPTHVIPSGGMNSYGTPDASASPTPVDEGLEVQVVEQQGDWARVTFSNGWSAWIDARALVRR